MDGWNTILSFWGNFGEGNSPRYLHEFGFIFSRSFTQSRCHVSQKKSKKIGFPNDRWVFPKIGGFPPKWMVKIMKNPMNKWMYWGVKTPIFGNIQININQGWRSSPCFVEALELREQELKSAEVVEKTWISLVGPSFERHGFLKKRNKSQKTHKQEVLLVPS